MQHIIQTYIQKPPSVALARGNDTLNFQSHLGVSFLNHNKQYRFKLSGMLEFYGHFQSATCVVIGQADTLVMFDIVDGHQAGQW